MSGAAQAGPAATGADEAVVPIRGRDGAYIIGPRNPARQAQEPSTTRPPKTDHGTMPNLKFSFADATCGWRRAAGRAR